MKIDDKNTFVFIILATATLSMITSSYTSIAIAMGQIFELVPHTNTDSQTDDSANNTLSFGIHFANNTNATLVNENITEQQGNVMIAAMNTILEMQNDSQALENLQTFLQQQPPLPESPELLPPLEEEEEELEEEEIEEEDSDDNDDNGNDDDSDDNNDNDDNDDNGNEGEEEEGPIEEGPIEEDENGDANEEEEQETGGGGDEVFLNQSEGIILTEGCGDGFSYREGGPYFCYPINKDDGSLQTEYPEGQAFCTSVGCPYSPPRIMDN